MKIWSNKEIEFLKTNSHMTYSELANQLNRTPMAVRFQFRKHKIKKIKSVHKKYEVNENFFEVWNNDMAYVLGFAFADSSIRKRQGNSTTWRLFNTDKKLLLTIRKILGSTHKIVVDKRTNKDFTLEINRLKIVEDLEKLGMTENNSKTMKLPSIPNEYFFDFVRGYFDGDGHVKVSGKTGRKIRIIFSSGSSAFLVSLRTKLEHLGITCSMRTLKVGEENENYKMSVLKKGRKIFYHGLYGKDPENFDGIKMESKYQLFIDYFEKNIRIQCEDCGVTMDKRAHNHVRCETCSHEREKQKKRESRKRKSQDD
jgi:hypothetical protein